MQFFMLHASVDNTYITPIWFFLLMRVQRRRLLENFRFLSDRCHSDARFLGYRVSRTHILRDACFPTHISLGMRVSHYISDTRLPTHISLEMRVPH